LPVVFVQSIYCARSRLLLYYFISWHTSKRLRIAEESSSLNVTHLASLSPDAIPALVEAFHSPEYFETMHEGIGAIPACYLYSERVPLVMVMDMDWRSFNLSRWRAHQTIREVRIELVGYRFRGNKWSVQTVRTPNNKLYNCTEYMEYR
jgi:hypothetical protein